MAYAIRLDWSEELKNPDKWINHGRNILENNCKHKNQDSGKNRETNIRYSGYCEQCEVGEDSACPMINCVYPLETEPSQENILEVVKRTNCTVMENSETGEYFLTLCGVGMNLSQNIALAYHLLEKWIPVELALTVCTQKELSIGGKDWILLKNAMTESLENEKIRIAEKLDRWKE